MVAYKDLAGSNMRRAEAVAVSLSREALMKSAEELNLGDLNLVRTLQHHGATMPEAIAMLLCEDLGPDHALIERIGAIVMLLDEIDSLEQELAERTNPNRPSKKITREKANICAEKRACHAMISKIEEHFEVSRDDAYRERAERRRS